MATIIIPTPLRKFTNQKTRLEVDGSNVKEAIEELALNFPDLKKHLLDENGQLRTFVNIFIGDDDIRNLEKENTKVSADSVVSIIPAIAGGTAYTDHIHHT
jgi:molybdopterin converting factor small subunit